MLYIVGMDKSNTLLIIKKCVAVIYISPPMERCPSIIAIRGMEIEGHSKQEKENVCYMTHSSLSAMISFAMWRKSGER